MKSHNSDLVRGHAGPRQLDHPTPPSNSHDDVLRARPEPIDQQPTSFVLPFFLLPAVVRSLPPDQLAPLDIGDSRYSRLADTAPFVYEAPLPEQVRLHVEQVKAAYVAGWIDAVKEQGRH